MGGGLGGGSGGSRHTPAGRPAGNPSSKRPCSGYSAEPGLPTPPTLPQQLTVDACRDGCKDEDEEEVEAKEGEGRRQLGAVQVVQEAGIGNDADGKQVLGQRLSQGLQGEEGASKGGGEGGCWGGESLLSLQEQQSGGLVCV